MVGIFSPLLRRTLSALVSLVLSVPTPCPFSRPQALSQSRVPPAKTERGAHVWLFYSHAFSQAEPSMMATHPAQESSLHCWPAV